MGFIQYADTFTVPVYWALVVAFTIVPAFNFILNPFASVTVPPDAAFTFPTMILGISLILKKAALPSFAMYVFQCRSRVQFEIENEHRMSAADGAHQPPGFAL